MSIDQQIAMFRLQWFWLCREMQRARILERPLNKARLSEITRRKIQLNREMIAFCRRHSIHFR